MSAGPLVAGGLAVSVLMFSWGYHANHHVEHEVKTHTVTVHAPPVTVTKTKTVTVTHTVAGALPESCLNVSKESAAIVSYMDTVAHLSSRIKLQTDELRGQTDAHGMALMAEIASENEQIATATINADDLQTELADDVALCKQQQGK